MTAENELSPAMKIFAWRGPSRSDVTDIELEATTPSPGDFVPIIIETVTPAAPVCQSALNSFQVTASKSFHLVSPISSVSCAV